MTGPTPGATPDLTSDGGYALGELIAADQHRYALRPGWPGLVRGLVTERTFRLTVTYRVLRAVTPRLQGWRRPAVLPFRLAHALTSSLASCDLPHQASIGPGLRIFHGRGLAVNDAAVIGGDVTIFGGVTIGRRDRIADDGTRHQLGAPVVHDRCWIGPNVVVVGPITVGEGARLAGGAVVMRDVPARSIVAGNPAEVIRTDAPVDVFHPWLPISAGVPAGDDT
jgi:serine O-acetyltransferase